MLEERGWDVYTLTPYYLPTRTFFLCQPRGLPARTRDVGAEDGGEAAGIDGPQSAPQGRPGLRGSAKRLRLTNAVARSRRRNSAEPPAVEGLLLPELDDRGLVRPAGVVEDDRRAGGEPVGEQRVGRVAGLVGDPADGRVDEQQVDGRQVGEHREVEPGLAVPHSVRRSRSTGRAAPRRGPGGRVGPAPPG